MSLVKKFELGDISKILMLVPKKRSEGEKYFREEKDGYYSLLTDNGDLNYTMLNETSKYILDLCDGDKNVGEILNILSNKFRDVERNRLAADLENALFNLTRIRLIKWKGEGGMNNSPFLSTETEKLEGDYTLSLANEEDIRTLQKIFSDFFKKKESNVNEITYFFGNDKREFLNFTAIRQCLYSYYKDFFIIKKEDEIVGIIVIKPMYEVYLNSATIEMIIAPAKILSFAMNIIKLYYEQCEYRKVNSLRIYLPEQEERLENEIKACGFKLEGVLKKEYLDNIDLKLYAL